MSITNELIDKAIVIKNFAKINILFYKFFNKKETKQILQIFKIYDGDNNESLYVKNFLDLVDGFFNIKNINSTVNIMMIVLNGIEIPFFLQNKYPEFESTIEEIASMLVNSLKSQKK